MHRITRLLPVLLVVAVLPGVHVGPAAAQTLPPGGTFIDDDGSPHEGYIEAIAAEDVTAGCDDEGIRYCPATPVARAQMASFLDRALDLPDTQDDFFDDDAGSVHEPSINRVAAAAITVGCGGEGDRRYCPGAPVSRAQMATFLDRALGPADTDEDFFDDDDGSVHEPSINRVAAAGITEGCAGGERRYCPDQAVIRAQMATFLGRALGLEPMQPPPPPGLGSREVASGLEAPLDLTAPAGDPRLFVVEQPGRIRIVDGGGVRPTAFLDIAPLVLDGGERGLLGLAFHPGYATNGRFFVNYTAEADDGTPTGATRIVEYRVSGDPDVADAASARVLLTVPQPYANHNGGQLAFGPDGHLYIALGDGGGAGDPEGNAQNTHSLLGKLLRIDVDGGDPYGVPATNPFTGSDGAREVWAYGLRNPWRFSFDPPSGALLIGDVGQGAVEEVDALDADVAGANYGWDRLEGSRCYPEGRTCSSAGTVLPVVEYGRDEGRTVVGGYVYRGDAMPRLRGVYFYGDYVTGFIRSFRLDDGRATDRRDWTGGVGPVESLTSFGVDGAGELYMVSGAGSIHKLVPTSS